MSRRSTIIIDRAGLTYAQITVTADSEVALVPGHHVGSYLYHAVRVDGRYYDLIRVTHADSNPEMVDAFNAVLSEIEQAVKALREQEVEIQETVA